VTGAPAIDVRAMAAADLPDARAVANAAFGQLFGLPPGAPPVFGELLFASRLEADAAGCFVAIDGAERVVGSLLSVARGPLAWFGPLAVDPAAQQSGVGARLVNACLEGWHARGVRTMGLETLADSPFHVRFYSRFGFRPAWTGVTFEAPLGLTAMPDAVEFGGQVPSLDFLYRGLDVSGEVAATLALGAGVVVGDGDGVAICHIEPTFQHAGIGFVPFLAARSRASFDRLLDACEHVCREHGLHSMMARVSGSSWRTLDAMSERGYCAGRLMVRMKSGENLEYDGADLFCIDNWL
jgi:GNAT superfamily N-acetyltransferase